MMADIDKEICQIKSSIHTAIRKPYARTLCHHAQMVLVKSKGSNCEENNENVKSFSPGISNRCNLEVCLLPDFINTIEKLEWFLLLHNWRNFLF